MNKYRRISNLSDTLFDIRENVYNCTSTPLILIENYMNFATNYGLPDDNGKYEMRSFNSAGKYSDKESISAFVIKGLNDIERIRDDAHIEHNYYLLNTSLYERDSIVVAYDYDTFYGTAADRIFSQVYLTMRNMVNMNRRIPTVPDEILDMLACAYYAYKSCMISDDDENNRIDIMYYRLTEDKSANHSDYGKMLLEAFHYMDEDGCNNIYGYDGIVQCMIDTIHDVFKDANEARYCLLGIQIGAVRNS